MRGFLFIALSLFLWTTAASAQVVVIAHAMVPSDTLTKSQLLNLYTGDTTTWENDEDVIVFDLKPRGEVRDTFYSYLGKTSSRMRSIWLKRKLAGEGDPPESFETEEEILEHVAATPGSIGFIRKEKVQENEVRILVEIKLEVE